MGDRTTEQVWVETGGHEGPLVVLLHGAGATGVVWDGVTSRLSEAGQRWATVDLPGHGRSGRLGRYSTGAVAAAVADALDPHDEVVLVGHSLGGLVALALSDPIFGLNVGGVLALSIKLSWSDEELARRAASADKPPRRFDDRSSAADRFARVSGLAEAPGRIAPDRLASGVRELDGSFVLANDPATAGVPPLTLERIAAQAALSTGTVTFACGDEDPMTSPEAMAPLGPVTVLEGAGHNVHVAEPDVVARLVTDVVERSTFGAPAPARHMSA